MRLKKGSIIGTFSPSTSISMFCPKRTERGTNYLKCKGFQVLHGQLMTKNDFYRSGTISERVNELNELINNKKVECIMSMIGGINSNSLLPYIDYDALIDSPKVIIGYSDITAILLAIYAKTGITTFYGPSLVASFGELPPFVDETYEYFKNILVDEIKLPYEISNPDFWTDEFIDWEIQDKPKERKKVELITIKGGKATGRLIGGNLDTIAGIWGTEFMPEIKTGDILFLEDSLKDIGSFERSIAHLKIAGIFEKLGGLILGKHERFDDKGTGRKDYDVLMEVIGDIEIPILADYNCSHVHPMITLPIGGTVSINADKQTITIEKY